MSPLALPPLPHQDGLVISAIIADFEVKRVLVDGGSSADILFAEAFDQMLIPRGRLTPAVTPLLGLGGRPIRALRQVQLPVTFGNSDANTRTQVITFDVVDLPYDYNAILGRGTLNTFDAVPHHNFLCLKLPGPEGVITIRGNQDLARRIELRDFPAPRGILTVAGALTGAFNPFDGLVPGAPKWTAKPKAEGETKQVPLLLGTGPCGAARCVSLGTQLTEQDEASLIQVLGENADVFRALPGCAAGGQTSQAEALENPR